MSVYDLHFNKDDVALRNILIGCLATLSDNINWYNQIGTRIDQRKKINVPFYFSTTGTERYLQDNFLNNIDFDPDFLEAETFYNKIPRGIVNFDGFSIETQAIVNKYVRMEHLKQEMDGTLNTYSSEAFMVPIILDLNTEIYVDSILDQLKCSEAIIKAFYKAKPYQVDIAYTRIPCLITFPDDQRLERSVEFEFNDKKEFKVTFSLQIKAHIPVFKDGTGTSTIIGSESSTTNGTTLFAGNTMETIGGNIYVPPIIWGPSGGGTALFKNVRGTDPATGQTSGEPIVISYNRPMPDTPPWPINPSGTFPPGPTNNN